MIIRAYLRASTKEQDANRARQQLKEFAEEHGARVTTYYIENASGASAERTELQRLLSEAGEGDILLVESIDRLSRLPQKAWEALKRHIAGSGLQVVAIDLPITHKALRPAGEGIEVWLQDAIAQMLLEFMAAFARKDYEQRRARQRQGIEKARAEGRMRGRQPDLTLHAKIIECRKTFSVRKTAELLGCSASTVQRAEARAADEAKSEERAGNDRCI